MRLNSHTKQAIVRSIMADVPKPDYRKRYEEIQAAIVKAMCPEARKLYKVAPKALSEIYIGNICYGGDHYRRTVIKGDVTEDTVEAICAPYKAEDEARGAVESKLRGAIEGCSTLKQLKAALPEFEKYFPTEVQQTKGLPALANVVADLTKLGWPAKAKA